MVYACSACFLILADICHLCANVRRRSRPYHGGLALGAYGLTQVLLQLPFGIASDQYGRKKVIYVGMLIFVIGSVVAALGTNIMMVIIGRAIQGAGAVSAVVMALVADSTREEHRTKAMATIGGTIGMTFALSLVAGPLLNQAIGVPGIFWMTAILICICHRRC